jgi:hypothetical protein
MNFKYFYEQKSKRDYEDFLDYLRSNGWQWKGSGAFASVFQKPNKNYVLKVYKNDPAYDDFLDFIEENQNDPHIPKIKRRILPLTSNQSENYGIVAIEKLDNLKRSDWRWRLVSAFESFLYSDAVGNLSFDEYINNITEQVRNMFDESLEKAKMRVARGTLGNTRSESRKLRRLDYFVETNLGIFKTFYRLKKFLESNGNSHSFDMHSGNFMMRPSTGEIVVTDPIAFF